MELSGPDRRSAADALRKACDLSKLSYSPKDWVMHTDRWLKREDFGTTLSTVSGDRRKILEALVVQMPGYHCRDRTLQQGILDLVSRQLLQSKGMVVSDKARLASILLHVIEHLSASRRSGVPSMQNNAIDIVEGTIRSLPAREGSAVMQQTLRLHGKWSQRGRASGVVPRGHSDTAAVKRTKPFGQLLSDAVRSATSQRSARDEARDRLLHIVLNGLEQHLVAGASPDTAGHLLPLCHEMLTGPLKTNDKMQEQRISDRVVRCIAVGGMPQDLAPGERKDYIRLALGDSQEVRGWMAARLEQFCRSPMIPDSQKFQAARYLRYLIGAGNHGLNEESLGRARALVIDVSAEYTKERIPVIVGHDEQRADPPTTLIRRYPES
jgi:hypothetical protein